MKIVFLVLSLTFGANFVFANSVADEVIGVWNHSADSCSNGEKPRDRWPQINSQTLVLSDTYRFIKTYNFAGKKPCRVAIFGEYSVNGKEIIETIKAVESAEAQANCGIRTQVDIGQQTVSKYVAERDLLVIRRPYSTKGICGDGGGDLVETFTRGQN